MPASSIFSHSCFPSETFCVCLAGIHAPIGHPAFSSIPPCQLCVFWDLPTTRHGEQLIIMVVLCPLSFKPGMYMHLIASFWFQTLRAPVLYTTAAARHTGTSLSVWDVMKLPIQTSADFANTLTILARRRRTYYLPYRARCCARLRGAADLSRARGTTTPSLPIQHIWFFCALRTRRNAAPRTLNGLSLFPHLSPPHTFCSAFSIAGW